jgi:hypothetical protein
MPRGGKHEEVGSVVSFGVDGLWFDLGASIAADIRSERGAPGWDGPQDQLGPQRSL